MIRIFEAFAGYGGGSFALKKIGIDFECVGYSEIDKNAIKCYDLNHNNIKNFGDISKINTNDIPDFDLFLGGFPCQDVSLAGKRDLSMGRTNLYKEILRICEDKKPKYILLENVAGLLSMGKERKLINIIVSDLNKIGYSVAWKKLNSKNFGIPQSRDRVWICCFRNDIYEPFKFHFPIEEPLKIKLKDILEKDVNKKYYLSERMVLGIKKSKFMERQPMDINKGYSKTLKIGGDIPCFDVNYWRRFKNGIHLDNIAPTLLSSGGSGNNVVIHSFFPLDFCPTITTELSHSTGRVFNAKSLKNITGEFRRLTPKECFRLMGFLNDEIKLDGLSDTAKYKLAGNGWEINLASKILKNMLEAFEGR